MGFYDKSISDISTVHFCRPKNAYRGFASVVSGHRYYDTEMGRWLSRDPTGEFDKNKNFNLLYGFVANNGVNSIDPFGLSEFPSTLDVIFVIEGHRHTSVTIAFQAGDDSGRDGKADCPCKKLKLAQAVSVTSYNLAQRLTHGYDGHWEMDGGAFYPYQVTAHRQASFTDEPGTRWYLPLNWLHPLKQDFETCAICTDDGEGKYWVISCAKWGHKVGGWGSSSRYGDGTTTGRTSASATFLEVFPSGLLGE